MFRSVPFIGAVTFIGAFAVIGAFVISPINALAAPRDRPGVNTRTQEASTPTSPTSSASSTTSAVVSSPTSNPTTSITSTGSTSAPQTRVPATVAPALYPPLAQTSFLTTAMPDQVKDYRNALVGYVLSVPTVLAPEPEFSGRNGRMFRSPDGGVVLTVHGGLTQPGAKPWTGVEPGDKVSYFHRLPGGWIKSGTRSGGKTRWYACMRSDATSYAVFAIAYPETSKAIWGPAVGKVNSSFSLV